MQIWQNIKISNGKRNKLTASPSLTWALLRRDVVGFRNKVVRAVGSAPSLSTRVLGLLGHRQRYQVTPWCTGLGSAGVGGHSGPCPRAHPVPGCRQSRDGNAAKLLQYHHCNSAQLTLSFFPSQHFTKKTIRLNGCFLAIKKALEPRSEFPLHTVAQGPAQAISIPRAALLLEQLCPPAQRSIHSNSQHNQGMELLPVHDWQSSGVHTPHIIIIYLLIF